jgi:hypothetical protein
MIDPGLHGSEEETLQGGELAMVMKVGRHLKLQSNLLESISKWSSEGPLLFKIISKITYSRLVLPSQTWLRRGKIQNLGMVEKSRAQAYSNAWSIGSCSWLFAQFPLMMCIIWMRRSLVNKDGRDETQVSTSCENGRKRRGAQLWMAVSNAIRLEVCVSLSHFNSHYRV